MQIQLPQEDLSFFQNLLDFFITKYLQQEVNNDLSIYMHEFSSCEFINLTWSKGDDITTHKFDN